MRIFLAPMIFSLALAAGPAAAQGTSTGLANPYAETPYNPQAGGGGYTSQTNPYAPGGIYDPYRGSAIGGSAAKSASAMTSPRKPLGGGLSGGIGGSRGLGASRSGLNASSGSGLMTQRQPGCGGTMNGEGSGTGGLATRRGGAAAPTPGCGRSTAAGIGARGAGNSRAASANPNLADTMEQSQINRLQHLPR